MLRGIESRVFNAASELRVHKILRAFSAVIVVVLFSVAIAQAQEFRARLDGRVQDQTGARVVGAKVVVVATDSRLRREARTDKSGEFVVDDLDPAHYKVIAESEGFSSATAEILLPVSSSREIVVTLYPAAVRHNIDVTAAASSITMMPLDSSQAVLQAAISTGDLDSLPLAHRSFANIAYLAPGTAPVEPSDPTKARITAVSFGGSSGLNVECSVDGADNSDDYIGGFLQNFSPEAIQEFSVRTAQQEADSGRTTGGSVVITTRRGTDAWHGEGAAYVRASALNARLPIDNPAETCTQSGCTSNPKQPFSRQNYVAALGGPIRPGRLWLFGTVESVREDASIAYSPQTVQQFNALSQLAAQGLIPGVTSIAVPSSIAVPYHDWLGSLRLDWTQSERSRWFLRGSVDRSNTQNDLVQQATLPSTGATANYHYWNAVLSNSFVFSPTWFGNLTIGGSWLGHSEARNSNLGIALAFPFSSTSSTISGFETLGDNQFVTAITAFPVERRQQKYQLRYDLGHSAGRHTLKFGINFIHEPVLSGALSGTAENLTVFALEPLDYVNNPQQFSADLNCASNATAGTQCTQTPAGNGNFSQNMQRLDVYAQDSWRATPRLTLNYGLHYGTTYGLFTASGRSQDANPAVQTLRALGIPLGNGVPHDYRLAFAPRIGIAYSPGKSGNTVIRAGFGLFYNDLAQTGWVEAFQAVNTAPQPCVHPGDAGCVPGADNGGAGALIDPNYHTPYTISVTAGVQHALGPRWMISADYVHEQGVHGYRRYEYTGGSPSETNTPTLFSPDPSLQGEVPNVSVFRSDNRSSYNALMLRVQGNVSKRFSLSANYTYSAANTWGCQLGELSDYVNGVCDPLHPFAAGDYGPSGEDVRHRFAVGATVHGPGGLQFSTLTQAESARPYTIVGGDGNRAVVNGVRTSLDEFRGSPYIQADLRVSRPIRLGEGRVLTPFAEFFNLFNRNNPGANYVADLAALPVDSTANATKINGVPITSLNQLRVPAGALGDFFGPGTTVGVPFSAQLGARLTF